VPREACGGKEYADPPEDEKTNEEMQQDRSKYTTLQKSGNFDFLKIGLMQCTDRIADEQFYMMMFM